MDDISLALRHGGLEEVFPNIFFVTGTMRGVFGDLELQFSRNMTVVRDGDALTLVNAVRLDDEGLEDLDRLGRVTNVVKIGSLHGIDDTFYVERNGATFWAMPGMKHEDGLVAHKELTPGGEMPFDGCSVFDFRGTKLPEGILSVDREGGILIACDALQNWNEPDEYFSEKSRNVMREMNFFQKANVGPVWMQVNEPDGEDFSRLQAEPYRHVLCGHGSPLRDTAKEDFARTFERLFGVR